MKNKIFIGILIIVIITFLVSMSPAFKIVKLNVQGNELVPTNEIIEKANLVILGNNIFTYSAKKYEKELKNNPYFQNVKITKHYPDTIDIVVDERVINFYTLYSNNTYLYMNNDGVVMDVKQNFTLDRPIIKGLEFNSFTLGEVLDVNDQHAFDSIVTITKTIKRYGDFENQILIDVTDPSNINILVNNINIVFGDANNADIKVRRALGAIPSIDPELKGYLYVNDINKDTYLKIIT